MVRAGAFLTVHIEGSAWSYISADTIKNGVAQNLQQTDLTIRSFTLDTPNILSATLSGDVITYPYQAALVVTPGSDHAQASEITAIIADAFKAITMLAPTSANETVDWKEPTSAPATGTTAGNSIESGISRFFETLQGDVSLVLVGLIALVALLIWTVGPNVRLGIA